MTVCESSRVTEANLQVNEVNESVAESSHQQTALSHHTLDAGTQTEVYLHHSSLQRWNTTSLVNVIQQETLNGENFTFPQQMRLHEVNFCTLENFLEKATLYQ